MQKWEYLLIVCEEERPRYVNGKEIPNWQQGATLFEIVNYLFRKDWELIDSFYDPNALAHVYHPGLPHHFRRLKQ